ncbi:cyclin-domain-containing protein [Entophlyctis helioformis]|nr:cyclin-domain-containing protein [Entophlyctis helioformis]
MASYDQHYVYPPRPAARVGTSPIDVPAPAARSAHAPAPATPDSYQGRDHAMHHQQKQLQAQPQPQSATTYAAHPTPASSVFHEPAAHFNTNSKSHPSFNTTSASVLPTPTQATASGDNVAARASAASAASVAPGPDAIAASTLAAALASACTCFMTQVWPSPTLRASAAAGANSISQLSASSSLAADQLSHPVSFSTFAFQLIAITRTPAEMVFIALRYLFQLRQRFPGNVENPAGAEYRLFVTALILAHKMMDDNQCSTKAWAKITSIPAVELAQMEVEFLSSLDYKLHQLYRLLANGLAGAHALGVCFGGILVLVLVSALVSSSYPCPYPYPCPCLLEEEDRGGAVAVGGATCVCEGDDGIRLYGTGQSLFKLRGRPCWDVLTFCLGLAVPRPLSAIRCIFFARRMYSWPHGYPLFSSILQFISFFQYPSLFPRVSSVLLPRLVCGHLASLATKSGQSTRCTFQQMFITLPCQHKLC